MLGKLLKQEWKSTVRILLPLYLILICTTLITGLLTHWDNQFKQVPTVISVFSYVVSLLMIGVGTIFLLYYRFYKNLLTDEGYLMFTLPVKTNQLVLSKLIMAFVLSLFSMAAIGLSLYCIALTRGSFDTVRDSFNLALTDLKGLTGLSTPVLFLEFTLLLIFSILSNIVTVYLAIALGQLFTSHRLIGTFLSYGALYLIIQLVSLAIMFIMILFKGMDYLEQADNLIIVLMIPVIAILSFLCYYGTVKVLQKKLNLE